MISKYMTKIDETLERVNNINMDELKPYNIEYLQCRRQEQYLFVSSVFVGSFLCNMNEIYGQFYSIDFPMKVFRNYIFLIIDLNTSSLVGHKIYTMPYNYDKVGRDNYSKQFRKAYENYLEDNLKFELELGYTVRSDYFNLSTPTGRVSTEYYTRMGFMTEMFDFNIDEFIKNVTVGINYQYLDETSERKNKYTINDPFYGSGTVSKRTFAKKDEVISSLECECVTSESMLNYICSIKNEHTKAECGRFHTKTCRCGKLTYQRNQGCMKCFIKYSKSKRIDEVFDTSKRRNIYVDRHFISIVPLIHYNHSSKGLCLGSGTRSINTELGKRFNPIRMILTFKTNMAFTDNSTTNNYYSVWNERIKHSTFSQVSEYIDLLYRIFGTKGQSHHIFSVYCYCSQCFFFKVVLHFNDKQLDSEIVDITKSYVVSRNMFIKQYKLYLENLRTNTYMESTTHNNIKNVLNKPPIEFIK